MTFRCQQILEDRGGIILRWVYRRASSWVLSGPDTCGLIVKVGTVTHTVHPHRAPTSGVWLERLEVLAFPFGCGHRAPPLRRCRPRTGFYQLRLGTTCPTKLLVQ